MGSLRGGGKRGCWRRRAAEDLSSRACCTASRGSRLGAAIGGQDAELCATPGRIGQKSSLARGRSGGSGRCRFETGSIRALWAELEGTAGFLFRGLSLGLAVAQDSDAQGSVGERSAAEDELEVTASDSSGTLLFAQHGRRTEVRTVSQCPACASRPLASRTCQGCPIRPKSR